MRAFVVCLLIVPALAAQSESSPQLERARQEVEKIRQLVEAGALPRARLEAARETLEEAQDDTVLRRTLYGQLTVEEMMEPQVEEMLRAAERRVARQRVKLERARKLVDENVAPRTSLTAPLQELDARRRTLDLAMSRAALFRQLAEIVRAELALLAAAEAEPEEPQGPRPLVERFVGQGAFRLAQIKGILLAFEKEFRQPLPISARGDTRLHRSLGFDHRDRVDVALNPDCEQGIWLRRYLEGLRIPYIAFRGFVRGVSTAAHIHIGPPSLRLRAAD